MVRQFFALCFIVTCIGGLLLLVMDRKRALPPVTARLYSLEGKNVSQGQIYTPSYTQHTLNYSSLSFPNSSNSSKQLVPFAACNITEMEKDAIQIVISVDTNEIQGVLALINSLKLHTSKALVIHIVATTEDMKTFSTAVQCAFSMTDNFQVLYTNFSIPVHIEELITTERRFSYVAKSANFARFFFYKLFPCLSHIIYLDADTIVQHDIYELWKIVTQSEKLLTAVPRYNTVRTYFESNVSEIFQSRYGKKFVSSSPGFNAGVVGMNLRKWRTNNVSDELVYWMQLNKQHRLWELGTQPIMYLLVNDDFERIDTRWNIDGLGYKRWLTSVTLSKGFILHWSGKRKPWIKLLYHSWWKKYQIHGC